VHNPTRSGVFGQWRTAPRTQSRERTAKTLAAVGRRRRMMAPVNAGPRRQGPPEAAAASTSSPAPELPRQPRPVPKAAVVVPVKAFSRAKMRLAPVLGPEDRAALAREMAEHVLKAARPLSVVVVCDDKEVAEWAEDLGARALLEPGLGLNGAVNAAVTELDREGYERLVVAHSDLPRATRLAWLADVEGIALVPDRREDGTNAISLPAGAGFRFSYGPGSFLRHQTEARRTGLECTVIHDPELAWDVDFPADIVALRP
jgi:2-phospho-L-lactate guanylyltransferase